MGYKVKEFPYELKIGRDINSVPNMAQTCRDQEEDYDYILVDTAHAMNFRTE